MQIMDTTLPEIKVLMPQRIGDTRGFFSEVWNARYFAAVGIDAPFVQDTITCATRRRGRCAGCIISRGRGNINGVHCNAAEIERQRTSETIRIRELGFGP
jgi:dTDP-4-dehydrorhamnose 3,5-epimerase-like enzyme